MQIEIDDVKYLKETRVTIRGYRRRTTIPKEIAEMWDLGSKGWRHNLLDSYERWKSLTKEAGGVK